ncbi:MAG TPA: ABC transporter permease, partial [Longimicrobiales bacterium]|nr:ABC transporter permease [Longimicrobiales bacterium]
TLPAVLTLALALGVNAAVFAVVDGLLLAPLPYAEADDLVQVWMEEPGEADTGPDYVSPNAWRSWTVEARGVAGMGLYGVSTATLLGLGDPEDVLLGHVQPRLLDRLAPRLVLGRSLTGGDADGDAPTLLLAYAFWRTRLGGDPDVVGRTLDLAGVPHVVVGVAEPGFRLPLDREVVGWSPLVLERSDFQFLGDLPIYAAIAWRGSGHRDRALAPLREELQALVPAPATGKDRALRVRVAFLERVARPSGSALPFLMGAVTLVLLLACADVTQLLLARGLARAPELSVRVALGAGPGAVGRMLAAEGALLALAGAVAALGLADVLLHAFIAVDPGRVPGWADVRLTPRVTAYLALAAAAMGLVTGLVPALRGAGGGPGIATGGRGRPREPGTLRTQRLLLTAQTALALMLLVGMTVLLQSWLAVQAVDPGFDATDLHTARIVLPPDRYAPGDGGLHVRFFEDLRRSLTDKRGIAGVAVATGLPTTTALDFDRMLAPEDGSRTPRPVSTRLVGPGYFETLGIPVVAGRILEPQDDRNAEGVVVLSRSAARLLLGTGDPEAAVGRRIVRADAGGHRPERVVGVVADVRGTAPDRPPTPKVYAPWLQSRPFGRMWIAVRPRRPGDTVWAAMRAALRDMDPELPLVDAASLEERVAATQAPRRFVLMLVTALGLLALVIAVVGMAGLAAFSASRARRHVAIRVALGAHTARALAPTVSAQLLAVAGGLVLGLGGTLATGGALRSVVFGVTPLDPSSLSAAAGLLGAVALAATLLPAWRAGRGEPREVLDA